MKLTSLFEDFRAYRKENGETLPDEPKVKLSTKDPRYHKKYYKDHAEKFRDYSKKYYNTHKDKIKNKLTKAQKAVLNYYRCSSSWQIPPYATTAKALDMSVRHVTQSTESLIKKWYLERWVTWLIFLKESIADAPVEAESVSLEEMYYAVIEENKRLKHENEELKENNLSLEKDIANMECEFWFECDENTFWKDEVKRLKDQIRRDSELTGWEQYRVVKIWDRYYAQERTEDWWWYLNKFWYYNKREAIDQINVERWVYDSVEYVI